MASLGRLVAGVAHEANTPIGNIRTTASSLSQQVSLFAARLESGRVQKSAVDDFLAFLRECAEIIERASGRAADLISNFKQLAVDQSSAACRQFEVGEILEIIVKSMAHFLRKNRIEITLAIESELRIFGEPGRLEQIIVNLMTNAATHAFEGREERHIVIEARRAGRNIQLNFTDDGIGIPLDLQDKIFEPFFTTKFGQGGSGLGLYIVHSIVTTIFNGRITVVSSPGQGTTFRLLIPVTDPTAPPRDSA
jgi:signal transduction histidine kinase